MNPSPEVFVSQCRRLLWSCPHVSSAVGHSLCYMGAMRSLRGSIALPVSSRSSPFMYSPTDRKCVFFTSGQTLGDAALQSERALSTELAE